MKKQILLIIILLVSFFVQAQIHKTIDNMMPGSLITLLTPDELTTINSLRLTGTIDASDFKTMRDQMPKLTVVDISDVTIAEYTGQGGTILFIGEPVQDIFYPANTVPNGAFYEGAYFNKDKKLSDVILPKSIIAIGNSAFYLCNNLDSINIPASVTSIGNEAFRECIVLKSIVAYPTTPVILPSPDVFYGVNKTTCTLYVPAESLELYKTATVWKDFLKIEAIISSETKNISDNRITVWPNPAKDILTINADKGVVSIYNAYGKLEITQSLEVNKMINISSLASGMYVAVVNGERFKIIKK